VTFGIIDICTAETLYRSRAGVAESLKEGFRVKIPGATSRQQRGGVSIVTLAAEVARLTRRGSRTTRERPPPRAARCSVGADLVPEQYRPRVDHNGASQNRQPTRGGPPSKRGAARALGACPSGGNMP
jgi:hypothetical protein